MNTAVTGRKPWGTPATGDIRLYAKDARVHGQTLRYESQPYKNVLGYWTNSDDWADWEFDVPKAGTYEVEIQLGCGKGSGGGKVVVEIDKHTLAFTVQDTDHFQNTIQRIIGEVKLSKGKHSLAVKPLTKTEVAAMVLRRLVLRLVPPTVE
jgi:arylsulfatase A